MLDIFGTEQKTAVAYYVSELLAKGNDNQQIITKIEEKFNLHWKLAQLNKVKLLLHKLWRCDIAHSMNEQIAQQLAEIRVQKKEAWEAWEKSKQGKITTSTKKSNSTSPSDQVTWDLDETTTNTESQTGEVKYLQLIADLGKEERKLLGLYAPEKKETNNRPNAIQFNILGANANEQTTDIMNMIMSMGATTPMVTPAVEDNHSEKVAEDIQPDDEIEDIMNAMLE